MSTLVKSVKCKDFDLKNVKPVKLFDKSICLVLDWGEPQELLEAEVGDKVVINDIIWIVTRQGHTSKKITCYCPLDHNVHSYDWETAIQIVVE